MLNSALTIIHDEHRSLAAVIHGLRYLVHENTLIPLARKHLTAEDWVEIGAAFGENGDPRFDAGTDHECHDLFSRIVNLAPPPIGVGPAIR